MMNERAKLGICNQAHADKATNKKESEIVQKYGKNLHMMIGLLQRQHAIGRKMQCVVLVDDSMDNIIAATAAGTKNTESALERLHSKMLPANPCLKPSVSW